MQLFSLFVAIWTCLICIKGHLWIFKQWHTTCICEFWRSKSTKTNQSFFLVFSSSFFLFIYHVFKFFFPLVIVILLSSSLPRGYKELNIFMCANVVHMYKRHKTHVDDTKNHKKKIQSGHFASGQTNILLFEKWQLNSIDSMDIIMMIIWLMYLNGKEINMYKFLYTYIYVGKNIIVYKKVFWGDCER